MLPLEQSMTLNHLKVGPLTEICLMYNSTSIDSLHLRPKIHLGMCFCSQYISLKKADSRERRSFLQPQPTPKVTRCKRQNWRSCVPLQHLPPLQPPFQSRHGEDGCEEIPAKKIQLIQRDRYHGNQCFLHF